MSKQPDEPLGAEPDVDPDTPNDESPEDPRAKALRMRQQRNTGPHQRDRAPRQLGVDGPP